jgi:hypothetical protein
VLGDLRGQEWAGPDQNGTYRRGPPLAAAVGGGDACSVEFAGDVSEAAAPGVFEADPLDDSLRPSRSSGLTWLARRLEILAKKALELGNGNQPLAPARLDGLHRRNEPTIDGGEADAQGFGCLTPAVGGLRA